MTVTVTATVTVGIEAVGVGVGVGERNRGWEDRGRRNRSRHRDGDRARDGPLADDDTVVVSVINLAGPGTAPSPRKSFRDVGHVDTAIPTTTTTTLVAWCSMERTAKLALGLVILRLRLLFLGALFLLDDTLFLDRSVLFVVVLLVGGSSCRSATLALLGGRSLGLATVLGSVIADVASGTGTLARGGDVDVVGLQQSLVALGPAGSGLIGTLAG
jgi:hypothetical protein